MPEKTQSLFGPAKSTPEFRSSSDRERDFRQALEMLQRLEIDNTGRDLVTRKVFRNDPIQVIIASDWHLGSIAGDLEAMYAMRDYILNNDNVAVIFAGDELEGLTQKYLSTNTAKTPYDFQQQVEFLKNYFLKPLADAGKVLGMVSEYWGHPGWANDATTINTWRLMVGDLDIPIIKNGGELEIQFPNKTTHRVKVWHNPPKSSEYDEVVGLRSAIQGINESSRPNTAVSGHIHRMGVAKEIYAGAKKQVVLISAGTYKGSNPDLPRDAFGIRLGAPLPHPQGQGLVIRPGMGRKPEMAYPFASLVHGEMAMKAITILDRTESNGIKDELLERIHSEVEEAPSIFYTKATSRLAGNHTESRPLEKVKIGGEILRNPYSHMIMRIPYDSLSYNINTSLPTTLHLIQNVKIGASSEGLKELSRYIEEVSKDPHSLFVFLRNMIDKESGKSPDRMEILQTYTDLVGSVSGQTLAVMMDESLRDPWWKKTIRVGTEDYRDEKKKWRTRNIYSTPIAPASYVANNTEVPLIHHLSLIRLRVGPADEIVYDENRKRWVKAEVQLKDKPSYTGAFADKLENYGSQSKPEWGLQRLYDLQMQEKPGYMAGGHMGAGVMTFFDPSNPETHYPMLIAPGWWASAMDTAGKGNVKPGAEAGQGIIFMPGTSVRERLAFPTVNASDTKNMKEGLTLVAGLEIMEKKHPGIIKKVMKKR